MAAAQLHLTIEQGATFRKNITLTNADTSATIDLTGWTISGKIKDSFGASQALATFTCTIANQGTNEGEFSIYLSASTTSSLPYGKPLYYDIEALKNDGDTDRLLQGIVTVNPEVTK